MKHEIKRKEEEEKIKEEG